MAVHSVTTAPVEDRLLLIRPDVLGGGIAADLSSRFSDTHIVTRPSLLSGICEAGRQRFGRIVVCIEPTDVRLAEAVRALRDAAGREARLVLCCRPEGEPLARSAAPAGADDYVVHPFVASELDTALGAPPRGVWNQGRLVAVGASDLRELSAVSAMLAASVGSTRSLANACAALIHEALDCTWVRVSVRRVCVVQGSIELPPYVEWALEDDGKAIGAIEVGPKTRGTYGAMDMRKLESYARMAGIQFKAQRERRRLRRLARQDDLTGLLNRRAFRRRFDGLVEHARRDRLPLTVVLFDVDRLKECNDRLGHDAGDAVLRTTADLLRRHCRNPDLVARIGGDEFAVVFFDSTGARVPGSRHPDNAMAVLARFRDALRCATFDRFSSAELGPVTISAGLASFPWDGDAREALLARADQALLEAKRRGRDRIVLISGGESTNKARADAG